MTDIEEQRDALVSRLFEATVGALELFSVYLGLRLGLYDILSASPELTVDELAAAGMIDRRYAREWLEQQAVAGLLLAAGDGEERRFALPAAHREVLADPESMAHVAPFSLLLAGIGGVLPELVDAYRSGAGVPYAAYGADLRDGQAAMNRPAFLHELADRWIAAMPDVHERLLAGRGARIADIACGVGWSTIAMARAFPEAVVHGFDLDEASIADARRNAAEAGVADRVEFFTADVAVLAEDGSYDLVCILEALHDLARPVEALAGARSMLRADGALLVVDERVAEEFTAPGDEVERMMYGWSVLHCLPAAMGERPTAATGTVLRLPLLRRYAQEAGFADVEVLPVDNDFFCLYRLRG